jgi:hypothetical protein
MLPRRVLQLFLFAAPLMLCTVSAQTSLQPPPIIPYGLPITIENAKLAAAAAVTEARSHKWAMAIAIVDPAGMLVYFEKMTDAQNASVECPPPHSSRCRRAPGQHRHAVANLETTDEERFERVADQRNNPLQPNHVLGHPAHRGRLAERRKHRPLRRRTQAFDGLGKSKRATEFRRRRFVQQAPKPLKHWHFPC